VVLAVGSGIALAGVPKNSVGPVKIKRHAVNYRHLSTGLQRSINGIGQVPAPPSAVRTISARLEPNTSASISAGGFTMRETTDASGSCNVEEITASKNGRYGEADFETPTLGLVPDAISAGATEPLSAIDVEGDYGQLWAMADDGASGAIFSIYIDDVGGRCNFIAAGIAT
jgi:hypothetical protein